MADKRDHLCSGPDGSQLVGFLCSLGLLECATRALPGRETRLGFAWHSFGWRPLLWIDPPIAFDGLLDVVCGWLTAQAEAPELDELGDDLPCDPAVFEHVARAALASGERTRADRLAAFGWKTGAGDFQDTALRTMSGAGHQHFLAFARTLAEVTTKSDLARCLGDRWDYADEGPSLRFDPIDDRRYALRADDPAASSSKQPIRTMRAANALVVEGLRLVPVIPARQPGTTLFDQDARPPRIRWPVWERPITRDAVGSLIGAADLSLRGVRAVFECRRLTVGKFRAFTPSRQVQ